MTYKIRYNNGIASLFTDSNNAHKIRYISDGGTTTTTTTTTTTPEPSGTPGITPVNDNIVRFYLPASSTSLTIGAGSSTGYYKLYDGTNSSSVAGSNYFGYAYVSYYTFSSTTLSGLGTGATKVVQLMPTDASGNYDSNAKIYTFGLHGNSTDIDAIDMSYCTDIMAAQMQATGSSGFSNSGGAGSSSQPSSITEIRAVGVVGKTGSQHGQVQPFTHSTWYYAGGIRLQGQDLDASALDQLYTDLGSNGDGDGIFVDSNPGTTSDTPSIATNKGWTVYGS